MPGNGHLEDVFGLPGEPIKKSSTNPRTAGKSGISLNDITLALDKSVRFR